MISAYELNELSELSMSDVKRSNSLDRECDCTALYCTALRCESDGMDGRSNSSREYSCNEGNDATIDEELTNGINCHQSRALQTSRWLRVENENSTSFLDLQNQARCDSTACCDQYMLIYEHH